MEVNRVCCPGRMIDNDFFGLVAWGLMLLRLPCGTQLHHETELDVL